MKSTTLTIIALAGGLTLGGCSGEESGAFLNQGDFGNATLNNQVEQTCRRMTPANVSKYGEPLASGCPGREQDGKYAMFAYGETIRSATEASSATVSQTDLAVQQ